MAALCLCLNMAKHPLPLAPSPQSQFVSGFYGHLVCCIPVKGFGVGIFAVFCTISDKLGYYSCIQFISSVKPIYNG